jgi:anti-anti-sigma regulatory factor
MFQVKADKSKNLLRINFTGHVDLEEAQRYGEQAAALLAGLQPGFQLLTDLSGLETMDFACARYIRQVMELCSKKGVAKVVRVIPDPRKDIGFNILSLFHYRRGIRIVTCETLEEAKKILAG